MCGFLKPTHWETAEGARGQTRVGRTVGRTVGRRGSTEMELSSGARKITPQGSGREDGMRERSSGRKGR